MADDEKGNLSVSNTAEFKGSATGPEDSESGSGIHTEIEIDKAAEKKLLWKLDLLILPILFLFYMMSYLDRVNIGNARIQGMDKELELNVDNRYNIALLVGASSIGSCLLLIPAFMNGDWGVIDRD